MRRFVIHTKETAPENARPVFDRIEDELGFMPNLFAGLADAPPVLEAYLDLDRRFHDTSLTPLQRNVVLLAASRANECDYCTAVHSTELAEAGFPSDQIDRLRNREPLSDAKLEALRTFTHRMVERRGQLEDEHIEEFMNAGFERPQVLEILLGVTVKTLSNYANHILDTPLDEPFAEYGVEHETETAASATATA